jgi:hypothetical protein
LIGDAGCRAHVDAITVLSPSLITEIPHLGRA